MPAPEPYAIQVRLRVRAGEGDAVEPLLAANARAARETEPGCLDFRVFRAASDPDVFVLFEVYVDRAALDAHRASEHYRAFAEAAGERVVERQLVELRPVD